jgi:hypothetical protein
MLDAYIPEDLLSPEAEDKLLAQLTDLLLQPEGIDTTNQAARALAWVSCTVPPSTLVARQQQSLARAGAMFLAAHRCPNWCPTCRWVVTASRPVRLPVLRTEARGTRTASREERSRSARIRGPSRSRRNDARRPPRLRRALGRQQRWVSPKLAGRIRARSGRLGLVNDPALIRAGPAVHADVVGPLLARAVPRLRYAAGRLGSGSDVLGFDDEMSRDHDWGCRLTLLVDGRDRDRVSQISGLLEPELPKSYRGSR